MEIPKLNFEVYFFEGSSNNILLKGPGHIRGTSFPGENGNCVISGYRRLAGAHLSSLDKLAEGDLINIDTFDGRYTYSVIKKHIVQASNNPSILEKKDEPILTIATFNQEDKTGQTLVIEARLR